MVWILLKKRMKVIIICFTDLCTCVSYKCINLLNKLNFVGFLNWQYWQILFYSCLFMWYIFMDTCTILGAHCVEISSWKASCKCTVKARSRLRAHPNCLQFFLWLFDRVIWKSYWYTREHIKMDRVKECKQYCRSFFTDEFYFLWKRNVCVASKEKLNYLRL